MNKQDELWQGKFGDQYHMRNVDKNRMAFWYDIIVNSILDDNEIYIGSVLEFGAGKGDNLDALREIYSDLVLTGIEINHSAAEIMRHRGFNVIEGSALEVVPPEADLVITRGFLIHVAPENLPVMYQKIYDTSNKYICLAEYYSPEPRAISYRGNDEALWCRDFASDMMAQYPDLVLLDYGFDYRGDGGDDLTWFLLAKDSDDSL
jgi:pseudaminic acid biosynthesis-associated methylase